jgi:hypothetical protein
MRRTRKTKSASIPSPAVSKASIPPGTCFTRLDTQAEADAKFLASMQPVNGHLRDFLGIMSRLTGGISRSFTIDDVLRQANVIELPLAECKRLFEAWTNFMIAHNKLEAINGIYDTTTFLIL